MLIAGLLIVFSQASGRDVGFFWRVAGLLSHPIRLYAHMSVPYSDPERDVLIGDILACQAVPPTCHVRSEKQMRLLLQEPLLLQHPITLPCPFHTATLL